MKNDHLFKSAKTNSIKNKKCKYLDALETLKKKIKRSKKRKLTKYVKTKFDDSFKNRKTKTMIYFDQDEFNSIKSKVVKGNTIINVTLRFIKGKMLMFAKVLLKSFVYDLIDDFYFPTEEVRKIYNQSSFIKYYLCMNLTNADSCSMCFNFICKNR